VELNTLVRSMQVVELAARSRNDAIHELVRAGSWNEQEIATEMVVAAIEDREATAHTVIAPGLALPHAVIAGGQGFRLVLGRSRIGVDFGAAPEVVHLVVLLLVGENVEHRHLEILAAIAELMNDGVFRETLVAARSVRTIRRLLVERAGRQAKGLSRRVEIPGRSMALLEHAIQLVGALSAQALLVAVDHFEDLPWERLTSWSGRLLIVTRNSEDEVLGDRADTHLFNIPYASLSRMDRA
jgi:diadenylate cyclase